MRTIVVCFDCDIELQENELICGNYCPNCDSSNLCGFEVKE